MVKNDVATSSTPQLNLLSLSYRANNGGAAGELRPKHCPRLPRKLQ